MKNDPAYGYEAIARDFIAYRKMSAIGAEVVLSVASRSASQLPNRYAVRESWKQKTLR